MEMQKFYIMGTNRTVKKRTHALVQFLSQKAPVYVHIVLCTGGGWGLLGTSFDNCNNNNNNNSNNNNNNNNNSRNRNLLLLLLLFVSLYFSDFNIYVFSWTLKN